MAKTSCRFEQGTGLTHYTLSIVKWQCSGTQLPASFYVTTDIPQAGHERNAYALGVSYLYVSEDLECASRYARAVVSSYRNHPRLRYAFDEQVFDAAAEAKHPLAASTVDVANITEYGLTQKLSQAVRVF